MVFWLGRPLFIVTAIKISNPKQWLCCQPLLHCIRLWDAPVVQLWFQDTVTHVQDMKFKNGDCRQDCKSGHSYESFSIMPFVSSV
jgi:hypothetical protein